MREREIETLRKPYELAVFVATETFDAEIDPVLELDIQDHEPRRTDLEDTTEVTA